MEQKPACVCVEKASRCEGGGGRYCGSCGGRSRRRGLEGARGDGRRVALCVAVCLSPRMESLPKGGYQLPFWPFLSRFFSGLALRSYVRLTMRDATTPDVCASFLFSPLLPRSETRRNCRDMHGVYRGRGGMMHLVERLVEVHQHFPFSFGGVVQYQRVEGVEG